MIIAFVLVLSSIGLIIAVALYSNFLPYFSLLSDIKNYNIAYYGANTAIERSLSVLRHQEAGFQGSGGWVDGQNINIGPHSDYKTTFESIDTLQREIIGRPISNTLPSAGRGDIEHSLLSGSNDFYTLSYRRPLRLPLWVDNTKTPHAYAGDNDRVQFRGSAIVIELRLNPVVKHIFDNGSNLGNLCNDFDNSGDGVADDVVVDRGWKGLYNDQGFSILPRNLIVFSGNNTIFVDGRDESIRESDINTLINSTTSIGFGDNINPLFYGSTALRNQEFTGHLMIAPDEISLVLAGDNFDKLLQSDSIIDQEITLFLARLLETCSRDIYPFLEYRISFKSGDGVQILPLPYFMIHGKSQVGNYTVNMYARQSIDKDSTLSSFTVVF